MNRLEEVRKIVDSILLTQSDLFERRCGFVHLYGVSSLCSLLALKRGLDVELCSIMGMLHDLSTYKTGSSDNHAHFSSLESRSLLSSLNCFSDDEISLISLSISNHSNKSVIDDSYSELLKDADVFQHFLYNTSFSVGEVSKKRLISLFQELDCLYSLH